MDYVLYFVGPLVLAFVGAQLLRQRYRVFCLGMLGFTLAWTIDQAIATLSLKGLELPERSFLYTVIISLAAGLVEESVRYLMFSRCAAFQGNRNARSGFMYAIGHHGMETMIVGLSIAVTIILVRHAPQYLTDPATLRQGESLAALGAGVRLYQAAERLWVGLLIQVCFSGVVMLAVAKNNRLWLLAAIGWHCVHNLIGLNLDRLSAHWLVTKLWLLFLLVVYTLIAMRIYQTLGKADPGQPAPSGPSSAILPGRTG